MLSRVQPFAASWTATRQVSLSFTICRSWLKFMHVESVRLSNHLILCHPLLLWPSIFPRIRIFTNESAVHIRWLKYWSFRISPSNDYSELISFRIDWFDLHVVQGTLKSFLQQHQFESINSSALMTTGKTRALTIWTFVGKVMSLLFFFFLSRFVIVFLLRSEWFLISWLQSPSAVIWNPGK